MKKRKFTETSLIGNTFNNLEEVSDFHLSRLPEVFKKIYPKIINKESLTPEEIAEDVYTILNFVKLISISDTSNFDYTSAYHDFFSKIENDKEVYSNEGYFFRNFCLKQENRNIYNYETETLEKEE